MSNTCAPWFTPRDSEAELTLHIANAGSDKSVKGATWLIVDDAASPYLSMQSYDVSGLATYPAWETSGPLLVRGVTLMTPEWTQTGTIGDGTFWTVMDGLPRERAVCQQVTGAIELRVATPVACVVRYEGVWTWRDN